MSSPAFHVPKSSFCNWGSDHQGPCFGVLSDPQSAGPFCVPLQVVGLQEDRPMSPVLAGPSWTARAKAQPPSTRPQAPTQGLAPGWGPGDPPGRVHISLFSMTTLLLRSLGVSNSSTTIRWRFKDSSDSVRGLLSPQLYLILDSYLNHELKASLYF